MTRDWSFLASRLRFAILRCDTFFEQLQADVFYVFRFLGFPAPLVIVSSHVLSISRKLLITISFKALL